MEGLGDIGKSVLGAGLGLITGQYNDSRQLRQQQRLQNMQVQGQKELGEYNRQLAMQMWEDTNYAAQVEQLRKAGLNIGLMYKGAGAGGTTQGASAGNVTGGQAPTGGGEIGMAMQMGMQMQLLKAQKENIEANTEKTKVDTVKTAGVDTQAVTQGISESAKRIENLEQDLTNKKITEKQLWQELQNLTRDELLKQLDAQIKVKELSQIDLDMEKTKAETIYKQMENDWMKAGVTTSDDPRLRMLIRILNEQGVHTFGGLMKAIKQAIF